MTQCTTKLTPDPNLVFKNNEKFNLRTEDVAPNKYVHIYIQILHHISQNTSIRDFIYDKYVRY